MQENLKLKIEGDRRGDRFKILQGQVSPQSELTLAAMPATPPQTIRLVISAASCAADDDPSPMFNVF